MIALLTGVVEGMEADRCIIDVNGVGYLVQASSRTLSALPAPPAVARLLIETHVREDAITLYGFLEPAEREWFRLLLTVQGVGARVALGLLSALTPGEGAISSGDRASLTRAPGVGGKLAIRLLSELRERVGTMPTGPGTSVPARSAPAVSASLPVPTGVEADVLSALANLGYRRVEAQPAVGRVLERLGDGADIDRVLRESLRELSKK